MYLHPPNEFKIYKYDNVITSSMRLRSRPSVFSTSEGVSIVRQLDSPISLFNIEAAWFLNRLILNMYEWNLNRLTWYVWMEPSLILNLIYGIINSVLTFELKNFPTNGCIHFLSMYSKYLNIYYYKETQIT